MDGFKYQPANGYYAILELNSNASSCDIRAAYKRLAMRWHPDKCNPKERVEAKLKFQEIQEAYAVLSDERKKMLYDSGLYNPEDDEEDIEGLSSFLNEMTGMMANVQASQDSGQVNSFEDLQQLFVSMFSADLAAFNNPSPPSAPSMNFNKKRGWGSGDGNTSCFGSCVMEESFPLHQTDFFSQTHYFFNETFHFDSMDPNTCKKMKCAANGLSLSATKCTTKGMSSSACDNGFSNKGSKGMAGLQTNSRRASGYDGAAT